MISAGAAAAAGTTRKQETIQRPHDTLRKSTQIAMKWNETKRNDSIWFENEKWKMEKTAWKLWKTAARSWRSVSLALRRATINAKGQHWQLQLQRAAATLQLVATLQLQLVATLLQKSWITCKKRLPRSAISTGTARLCVAIAHFIHLFMFYFIILFFFSCSFVVLLCILHLIRTFASWQIVLIARGVREKGQMTQPPSFISPKYPISLGPHWLSIYLAIGLFALSFPSCAHH